MNMSEHAVQLERALPVLPLRNAVLFPAAVMPLAVGPRGFAVVEAAVARGNVFVVRQHRWETEDPRPHDLAAVGVLARVTELKRSPDRWDFVVMGLERVRVESFLTDAAFLEARGEPLPEDHVRGRSVEAAEHSLVLIDRAAALLRERPDIPMVANDLLRQLRRRGYPAAHVADLLAANFCPLLQQQICLETRSLDERLQRLSRCLDQELEAAQSMPFGPKRWVRRLRCAIGW